MTNNSRSAQRPGQDKPKPHLRRLNRLQPWLETAAIVFHLYIDSIMLYSFTSFLHEVGECRKAISPLRSRINGKLLSEPRWDRYHLPY